MKFIKIVTGAILTGIAVALTYWIFESTVRRSINYIWDSLLDTDERRLVMIAVCIVLGFIYFGLQHYLDAKSENKQSEGLGGNLSPSFRNFLVVLLLGFYSLIAGASLGPEAVLVPACLIAGGIIGSKISNDKQIIRLLGAAGFVALFVAFFNSLFFALLGLYLLRQETKAKLSPAVIIISLLSSISTFITLRIFEAPSYFNLPPHSSGLSTEMLAILIALFIAGYIYIKILITFAEVLELVREKTKSFTWWKHSLFASSGLSLIFLAGGPLIQFTGNESINPMLSQAPSLGLIGLLGLFLAKTLAIAWSKTMGYRGGMIFPSVFVAATLVAMAQFLIPDFSVPLGIITVLAGILYANSKKNILL